MSCAPESALPTIPRVKLSEIPTWTSIIRRYDVIDVQSKLLQNLAVLFSKLDSAQNLCNENGLVRRMQSCLAEGGRRREQWGSSHGVMRGTCMIERAPALDISPPLAAVLLQDSRPRARTPHPRPPRVLPPERARSCLPLSPRSIGRSASLWLCVHLFRFEARCVVLTGLGMCGQVGSGALIGCSFVFKKKGLLQSQAGGEAGEGVAYLKSWMWWIGMSMMIAGELCNFGGASVH